MTDPRAAASAEVARSEELDLAGQHAAALAQLVAGVHKQDIEATTRLGKRLLMGDRAPHKPGDGASLLADASKLGGAEAAAIYATLLVISAPGKPELESALITSLVLAAERGWSAAQDQIRVLAGIEPNSAEFAAPRGDWRRLGNSIDIAVWHSVPTIHNLHEQPRVCSLPSFAHPAVCQWLIKRARGRLERANVYNAVTRQNTVHQTRTNTAALFNLLETDCVLALVQHKIAHCLNLSFRHLEPAAVLHYDVGEEIRPHFDFVDPNVPNYTDEIAQRGQRIVTFLLYLNEDYGDGQTDFPRLGVSNKGRLGEGLYFINALEDGKADIRTLHAGRPPSSGEKWIVSQFVRNRPLF